MTSAKSRRAGALTYRKARLSDRPVLIHHRHRMWSEIGHRTEAEIAEHDQRYRNWLTRRIQSGEAVGFVAYAPDGMPVGSGLVWFRSDQPRPKIPGETLPYILSMYTDSQWRGRGVASGIVRRLVATCRERGYPSVVLHASEQGRSLYGRLGFERTWEERVGPGRYPHPQPPDPHPQPPASDPGVSPEAGAFGGMILNPETFRSWT
jgi:GNAT superfamily N-acetyltransferase